MPVGAGAVSADMRAEAEILLQMVVPKEQSHSARISHEEASPHLGLSLLAGLTRAQRALQRPLTWPLPVCLWYIHG